MSVPVEAGGWRMVESSGEEGTGQLRAPMVRPLAATNFVVAAPEHTARNEGGRSGERDREGGRDVGIERIRGEK